MTKLAINGGPRAVPFEQPQDLHVCEAWNRGERVKAEDFAARFADAVGARYALPVKSGTAALVAGLAAVGVGPGDEVLVVSYTYLASVASIILANAIPVFVDIDPVSLTMDVADLERRITARTRAIMPVDIYGHPADLPRIMKLARQRGLAVVEDACQATGAAIGGRKLGSFADVTAFSFSGKPLTSTSGGILTTDSRELYERACLAGQHPVFLNDVLTIPELRKYISTGGRGDNHRIDVYALNLAHERLARLEEANAARIENVAALRESLAPYASIVELPQTAATCTHVFHAFTLMYRQEALGVDRERFVDALRAEGVPILVYMTHCNYPAQGGRPVQGAPVHYGAIFQEQNVYGKGCPFRCPFGAGGTYRKGDLPVTERLVHRELNIMQQALDRPLGTEQMRAYGRAFAKVIEGARQLRG